jgi:hypothetical protein
MIAAAGFPERGIDFTHTTKPGDLACPRIDHGPNVGARVFSRSINAVAASSSRSTAIGQLRRGMPRTMPTRLI